MTSVEYVDAGEAVDRVVELDAGDAEDVADAFADQLLR